jgi:hypothetical protein
MRPLLISAVLLALAACGKPEAAQTAAAPPKAAASPAGLTLGADGVPRLRPGLWEVAKTDDGETETTRECMGDEANAELREMLTRETPNCKVQRSGGAHGLKVASDCVQSGVRIQTTFTLAGSDTAYDMSLGMHVVKPDGSREGGEMTAKARWIGACPAGVEPGQTLEP